MAETYYVWLKQYVLVTIKLLSPGVYLSLFLGYINV